ncbi:MAG: hypothetical protein ABWY63_01690 [Hyphomicrobiaceae bacterium]
MAEQSKDETKLGPNVTYQPENEDDKTPLDYYGVTFVPGKSVNVEEALGSANSEAVLKKLAGNRYFKVDGGVDHREEQKKREKAEQEASKVKQKAQEEAARKAAGGAPPPPDDWQGPDSAELETDSAARRPPLPKAK